MTISAVAKTATVSVTPALLRVERMAQPAIAALSAVAASARVACALSLVFRRMLFPASQVTWRLAAALEAPAAVSENLLVEATAPAGALVFPVQPPATVRQDSSASRLGGPGACVMLLLTCALRADSQGSVLTRTATFGEGPTVWALG